MNHQITITKEDFEQFNKVQKVIYNDVNNLLLQHGLINLVIKDDGSIHFNLVKTGLVLTKQERVLRAIFNFYFFCTKNSHLFSTTYIDKSIHDESWYKQFQNLSETLKNIKQDDSKTPFHIKT